MSPDTMRCREPWTNGLFASLTVHYELEYATTRGEKRDQRRTIDLGHNAQSYGRVVRMVR